MSAKYPRRNRCNDCNLPMTWADVRRQFGRLMKTGVLLNDAKAVMPLCQHCTTKWLRFWRARKGCEPSKLSTAQCRMCHVENASGTVQPLVT